jgi:O-antigen ligase
VNLVEGDRLGGAVGGIFKNPNDLALNLVTFLAPTLFIVIQERKPSRRIFAALIAVLMLTATVFTKSRSGVLGLIAMGIVVVYYTGRVKPGMVIGVVLSGFLALPMMPESFWNRMDSIVNPAGDPTGSRAARIRLLNQGLEVFAENPVTGIGAGQFQNYNGPGFVERWRVTHNVWLQVAAELGVFGLTTFAFLVVRGYVSCFATLRMLRRGRQRRAAPPTAGRRQAALAERSEGRNQETRGLPEEDARILDLNAKSMMASLVGWTVCAFFASVAFNWTFYYVLALSVAGREIMARRREAPVRDTDTMRAPRLVRAPA